MTQGIGIRFNFQTEPTLVCGHYKHKTTPYKTPKIEVPILSLTLNTEQNSKTARVGFQEKHSQPFYAN